MAGRLSSPLRSLGLRRPSLTPSTSTLPHAVRRTNTTVNLTFPSHPNEVSLHGAPQIPSALKQAMMQEDLKTYESHMVAAANEHAQSMEQARQDRIRKANQAWGVGQGQKMKMLRMLMLGPPGSGKGTLSNRLVAKYDVHTMVMGDILRDHVARGTSVGKQAEEVMKSGGLLPDDVVTRLIEPEIIRHANDHWILDGFPRTVGQAKLLDSILARNDDTISLVVSLKVPDSVILDRIENRWIHQPSGRVYNTTFNPPRISGLDDITGEPLTKRLDDNVDTFRTRLERYHVENTPILDHYHAAFPSSFSEPLEERSALPIKDSRKLPPGLRPLQGNMFRSLTGHTSGEIWPQLEELIVHRFPQVEQRAKAALAEEDEVDGEDTELVKKEDKRQRSQSRERHIQKTSQQINGTSQQVANSGGSILAASPI